MRPLIWLTPIILSGCLATDDQLSQLVTTINSMKDATVKAINDNQKNQADLANQHRALVETLQVDAGDKPLAKTLQPLVVKAAIISSKAEELSNVKIDDATKPENPFSGLFEAILQALMANPTMTGGMTLITGLLGQQMWKNRRVKQERNELYSKNNRLKTKVAKVAMQDPKDVDIEEELRDV